MSLLSLENVSVKDIIHDISFKMNEGEQIVILGRNGAGKTTLIKAILGIIQYEGKIYFKHKDINNLKTYERAKMGISSVLQNPPDISYLKVNALFRNIQTKEITKLLDRFDLPETILSKNLDDSLSGGERKKIELIHTILQNKELIILDEWDSGVDVKSLNTAIDLLKNKSLLVITHNPNFALKIASKIHLIKKGRLIKGDKNKMVELYERDVD